MKELIVSSPGGVTAVEPVRPAFFWRAELWGAHEANTIIITNALLLVGVFADESRVCVRCSKHVPGCRQADPARGLDRNPKRMIADLLWVLPAQRVEVLPVSGPRRIVSIKPLRPALCFSAETLWALESDAVILTRGALLVTVFADESCDYVRYGNLVPRCFHTVP